MASGSEPCCIRISISLAWPYIAAICNAERNHIMKKPTYVYANTNGKYGSFYNACIRIYNISISKDLIRNKFILQANYYPKAYFNMISVV